MATKQSKKQSKKPEDEAGEIGNGINSTPEEIKQLGGLEKLRAKIKAKNEAAKNAEQPRV